ncbi:MAG: nitroreductase family protein [Synergistaceae bacterium]|jgi:SagB-type dehydrogenase family enzyme|nr:nitroreductase family protein [Synergistaceae bacterium]
MKKAIACLVVILFQLLSALSASADIKLPSPQTEGGMGLFESLKKRASSPGGDFPTGALSDEELSNVLWAATGLNRGDKGWTVPMDKGEPPYVDVYAANDKGVFMYDWSSHSLVEISKNDIRANIGLQKFVEKAPCSLIFVADAEALSVFTNETLRAQFADVAAGAMTQNVYLVSSALGLGARYIHSVKDEELKSALNLPDENRVICLMMLGK